MFILALADDLTGALEVGAKFSAAGIISTVRTEPRRMQGEQAVVYDTETRHAAPDEAARKVKRFVQESGIQGDVLLYKKTDSTLRGNIAAELAALADLFPDMQIGYAPAYPEMGRTVRQGILYVDGTAVAETEFASDQLNPVRASAIAALVPPQARCTIFDGEHTAHVAAATRTMLANLNMRIVAGPGALAETLARHVAGEHGPSPALPRLQSCLVLNGSRHERAARQMRYAEDLGWRAVYAPHPAGSDAMEVADANSRRALDQLKAYDPDGILIIGGDTAFAFLSTLGLDVLEPIGEAVPGVPMSRIRCGSLQPVLPHRTRDLILMTKAGGFGEPDVLRSVRQRVSSHVD